MHTNRITSSAALLALALLAAGGAAPSSETAAARPAAADDRAVEYGKRYGIAPRLARTILDEARESGVAPGIAFGLIEVESGFDPRAVGRHGERGLMQVKPSTARAYERGITADGLVRPEVNLRIGLAHLKREADHFGDWRLGLLAYNMGRSRLSRILASGERPAGSYAERVLARCPGACA